MSSNKVVFPAPLGPTTAKSLLTHSRITTTEVRAKELSRYVDGLISLGGALARAAWGGVMRAATEILESGTFEELGQAPSMSEMSKFLKA